jgi:hypothetical protein
VSTKPLGCVYEGPPAKVFDEGDVGVVTKDGGEAPHAEELGKGDVVGVTAEGDREVMCKCTRVDRVYFSGT